MRRSWLLVCLLAVVPVALAIRRNDAAPLFSHGGAAPLAAEAVPLGLKSTSAQECGRCHSEIFAEWRSSLHASAWTDPVFQAAYADEPLAACRNCHAPANGGQLPDGLAAADGISCTVCHVRSGKVLGVTGMDAPHVGLARPVFARSEYCAGCHQFGFLAKPLGGHRDRPAFESDEVQQGTFDEWRTSRAARDGESCQSCHMPWVVAGGKRHRSHRFLGGFDDATVKEAVSVAVSARRQGDRAAVLATFTPGHLGHAFPTGDLFRRAEFTAWIDPPTVVGGKVGVTSATFAMARAFRDATETIPGHGLSRLRREVSDTRLLPAGAGKPMVRTLILDAAEGATIHWSFKYLLMPTPSEAATGGEPVHSTTIAQGEVVVGPSAP